MHTCLLFKLHTACVCFSNVRLIESVHTQSGAINNLPYAEQARLHVTQVHLSAELIYARTHRTLTRACSQTHGGPTYSCIHFLL